MDQDPHHRANTSRTWLEPHGKIGAANVVYKIDLDDAPEFLGRFVGVVIEHSSIMKVRFDYGGRTPVSEGNLLEANVSGNQVLYQVVQGLTEIEALEQKNEAGLIVGEAIQLGIWVIPPAALREIWLGPGDKCSPSLAPATPAFVAARGRGAGRCNSRNKLPCVAQPTAGRDAPHGDSWSHRIRKVCLLPDLLRKIISDGTKVICVDFTNEYRSKFPDLAPENVVPPARKDELFEAIDTLSTELEKFANQQNKQLIASKTEVLKEGFYQAVKEFMQSEKPLALFELPDVSNTTGILEYTKWFFLWSLSILRVRTRTSENKFASCWRKRTP